MEWTWAEDRAPVGTDPSADPGVVSEDRAAATPPPTSLAYNTNAINPTVTQPHNSTVTKHLYPANSANSILRFTLNQDTWTSVSSTSETFRVEGIRRNSEHSMGFSEGVLKFTGNP